MKRRFYGGIAVWLACFGVVMAAQTAARRWSGPAELEAWRSVGRPPGSVPHDAGGLVVLLDPHEAPHTLRSPRLKIRAADVRRVRVTYKANYSSGVGAAGDPIFLVGWIDNLRDIENMEGCGLTIPVKSHALHTIEVDLSSSHCWRNDAVIHEIDINVDGMKGGVRGGTVHIYAIELLD